MKKILYALLITLTFASCKRCYQCTLNAVSNGQVTTGSSLTREVCGSKKEIADYENGNTYTFPNPAAPRTGANHAQLTLTNTATCQ